MEVLLTVIIVEHLTGTGKQRLDVFPYPRGSIADDTKPHVIFRNHACFFDLLKGFAKLRLILHLMPTEQMDNVLLIHQIEAKALGITPLAAPRCPSGPRVTSPRWRSRALSGRVGTYAPSMPSTKTGRRKRPAAISSMQRSMASRDGATSKTVSPSAA